MLQNPVHVVPHLAQNKQNHYFSFLDFSIAFAVLDKFLKNFIFFRLFLQIPSYIVGRDPNYDNKRDE
jgi:hypothetical protein